jgi:hypothetical protein
MHTESTLPSEKASIDGTYSNQTSFTSRPASRKKPRASAMSHATHPGQSLYAMVNVPREGDSRVAVPEADDAGSFFGVAEEPGEAWLDSDFS